MLGLRELAMVATVVLVLYGRTSVLRSRRFQSIWPWIAPCVARPVRPGSPSGPSQARPVVSPAFAAPVDDETAARRPGLFRLEGNRLFWFLTILAATAVASAVVSRMMILHDAGTAAGH